MSKEIEKWIDLNKLPKWSNNGKAKKGTINWKESIGYKCSFKYYDIKGEVEIVDYTPKGQKLIIKYLDYDLYKISTAHFKKCQFGKLLKKRTNEFKIKIGQTFKDDKRDLIIIDKEYRKDKKGRNWKYYKYHCNLCENEDWIEESNLIHHNKGCNVCSNKKVIQGINNIYTTDKWMIGLGVSEEDSKKYTSQSNKKIKVKCPNCGKEKEIRIGNIYNNKSICCSCGDGISYPEKIVLNLLDQLNINYIKEYSPEWSNKKRYDFYFKSNSNSIIIEVNGGQHYNGRFSEVGGRNLEQEKENDKYKKELALNNGIDYYIELDCRESNLNYIKKSILNSELNNIFELNKICWSECEEFALSNRVKEVCDYWRIHNDINNEGLTTNDLSEIFKLSKSFIYNSINKGNKLGWCNYNPKNESFKGSSKSGKMNGKQVEIFDKNKQSLGVFESCAELERQSEELFGVKLFNGNMSNVALGKKKQYKGFTFKYIEN